MLDLDDLDHLDRLDDAAPPQPDAALLLRVHRQVDRRRRRNRLAAVGALAVVLAIGGGVAAVVRGRHSTAVIVTGPPPVTSTSTSTSVPTVFAGPSSAGTLPNGLHVVMTLATPAVQLGSDLPINVVVRNDTPSSIAIGSGDIACALRVGPALKDATGTSLADKPPYGPACAQNTGLPPGTSKTFVTSLPTWRVGLKRGAHHGHYTVTLMNTFLQDAKGGARPPAKWNLPPVPIEINAPDLTIRIDVSTPTVAPGGVISGSIVFDNAGTTTISAGCPSLPAFAISLNTIEAGQSTLVNPAPQTLIGAPCTRRELRLGPGTTTPLTFDLTAKYYDCYPPLPKGQFLTDGPYLPTCVGSHVPPPLPAGRYQLGFTGAGPLGAVVVAPVSVTVRTGPSQGRTSYP
jgi:hypothetical protein